MWLFAFCVFSHTLCVPLYIHSLRFVSFYLSPSISVLTSLNFIYVVFDYYFSYFVSNIYNHKMCWYVSFVYNLYHELKDKEIWNRMNSKKDDFYIVDFYGDLIFIK